jgi:hypothetical protein
MPLVAFGFQKVLFLKFDVSVTKANGISDVETTRRDHTKCPVPVRLSARVSTFLPKDSFEVLDVCAMPVQELGSEVDLGLN